jgi:hypothetical protein
LRKIDDDIAAPRHALKRQTGQFAPEPAPVEQADGEASFLEYSAG